MTGNLTIHQLLAGISPRGFGEQAPKDHPAAAAEFQALPKEARLALAQGGGALGAVLSPAGAFGAIFQFSQNQERLGGAEGEADGSDLNSGLGPHAFAGKSFGLGSGGQGRTDGPGQTEVRALVSTPPEGRPAHKAHPAKSAARKPHSSGGAFAAPFGGVAPQKNFSSAKSRMSRRGPLRLGKAVDGFPLAARLN